MKYEIDIFDYLNIYKKHWKRMTFLIIVAVFVTTGIQSLRPITYRSILVALTPTSSRAPSRLGGYLGLPDLAMGASSNRDVIFFMLRSRRMRKDINEHFSLKNRPRFWWSIDAYKKAGGFEVEVTGPDPEMIAKIANFAADNVDKINKDLEISSELDWVKVLDHAVTGVPIERNISKKAITSGLFVFLIYALLIFFKEYFSQLKESKK